MTLIILILLTSISFISLFSIYIRKFSRRGRLPMQRRQAPPISNGLSIAIIESFPLYSYDYDAGKYPTECSVCLSEFRDKEMIKAIPYCGHVFHPGCIDKWLSGHVSCPVCRSTQMFPSIAAVQMEAVENHGLGESSTVEIGNMSVERESDVTSFSSLRLSEIVLLQTSSGVQI